MAKENLTVTIEENLLRKSKEVIPNLSAFFEECLAKRIGWGEETYFPVHSAEEELDRIGNSMVNLHIMTEKQDLFQRHQELEEQKLDLVWRKIFSEYRNNPNIELSYLQEASEILCVSSEVLADVLYLAENVESPMEKAKFNKWKASYEYYLNYLKE